MKSREHRQQNIVVDVNICLRFLLCSFVFIVVVVVVVPAAVAAIVVVLVLLYLRHTLYGAKTLIKQPRKQRTKQNSWTSQQHAVRLPGTIFNTLTCCHT